MAIPDLSNFTLAELRELMSALSAEIVARENAAVQEEQDQRDAATGAITALEDLLGPEGAPAGTGSIRAVLAYGDAAIMANASQAVPLIIHGMEILTETVLALARVVRSTSRR